MIVELGSGRRVDVSTRAVVIARLAPGATVAEVEAAASLRADAIHLGPVEATALSPLAVAAAGCGLGVMVETDVGADVSALRRAGATMVLSARDEGSRRNEASGWFLARSLDEAAAAAPYGVIDAAALAPAAGHPAIGDLALELDAAALAIEVAAYRRGARLFLSDDVRRTRRALDAVAEVARHRVAS